MPNNLDTTNLTATGGMRYELIAGYKQFSLKALDYAIMGASAMGIIALLIDTKLASSVMNYGVN